jgi:hypothetical protein
VVRDCLVSFTGQRPASVEGTGLFPVMERQFTALLRGAFAKVFEEDASITPELLKEQIFAENADVTLATVRTLLGTCCNVLRQAGYANR